MSDLADKKCIPCEGNIPAFKIDEIHKYIKKVDGWNVEEDNLDGFHILKNFKFENSITTFRIPSIYMVKLCFNFLKQNSKNLNLRFHVQHATQQHKKFTTSKLMLSPVI